RDRLLQPAGDVYREPRFQSHPAALHAATRWTRLVFGASAHGCGTGNALDDVSGRRNAVVQVHAQRVAVRGQHDASRHAELAARPNSKGLGGTLPRPFHFSGSVRIAAEPRPVRYIANSRVVI